MKTLVLPQNGENTAAIAAQIIQKGGLVAIPTETVYGLGADGLNPAAVDKIYEAKGRPKDNPMILHVTSMEQVEGLCHSIPQSAYALAEKYWPGPLTMILPAKEHIPKRTTGGLSTVAVRCPDSEITRKVIELSGTAVAAPSANLSGKPSTTTAQHVLHDHDGNIDAVIDGGACRVGVESTIIDLTENPPRLLRPGGITPAQLRSVLGTIVVDKAVTAQLDPDEVAKAPGMKYRHYAPECQVVIVSGSREAAARYIRGHYQSGDRVLCFEEELPLYEDCNPLAYGLEADVQTLSAGLFAALRELDDPAVHMVYARCPEGEGVAYAVQNRLKKAAAFQIIDASKAGKILGITGGTGCGKTTALQAFSQLGGVVLDCDEIYHRLLETDGQMLQAIADRFPGTVEDGALQRKKLGAIVFADKQALSDLNRITHSAVKKEVLRQLSGETRPVAIDAIGLFEGGLAELCDHTVAITAPEDSRIERLMEREGISREYAVARIAAQRPQEEFVSLCDHHLQNGGTIDEFYGKCLAFFQEPGIM